MRKALRKDNNHAELLGHLQKLSSTYRLDVFDSSSFLDGHPDIIVQYLFEGKFHLAYFEVKNDKTALKFTPAEQEFLSKFRFLTAVVRTKEDIDEVIKSLLNSGDIPGQFLYH